MVTGRPYCKKCGTSLGDDAEFCSKCGTRTHIEDEVFEPFSDQSANRQTIRVDKPVYGVVNLDNLLVGHEIDDWYQIKQKVAEGGIGATYSFNSQR